MDADLDAGWVVLRTQPRRELVAAESVRARGVESYLPFWRTAKRPADAEPVFPGYLFARVGQSADDLLRIRSTAGVLYVLPHDAPPTVLSESLVNEIRLRLASPAGALAPRPFQPGERVTIVDGPFRRMDALFERRLNAAGRVQLLLELVHGTVKVNIPEASLERA
jgi:transcriptional antiterminator RfaH